MAYALGMAPQSLLHSRSAMGDEFRRLRANLGMPKAITAMTTVTRPANGSVGSTLTIATNGSTATGTFSLTVRASSIASTCRF